MQSSQTWYIQLSIPRQTDGRRAADEQSYAGCAPGRAVNIQWRHGRCCRVTISAGSKQFNDMDNCTCIMLKYVWGFKTEGGPCRKRSHP